MLSKTKKLLFLTTGLAGALVVSSIAGVALSSCTVEAVNGGNNGSSSDGITLPDTWYNKDINWSDATSLNNLIIDKQGFVYSNKYMTEIIAILPGYESSTLVIPSTVTSISGYNNVTVTNGTTTKTPAGAFQNLTSITSLKFAGNKITSIGSRAFYNCTSLQNVVFPSSVTLIDTYAFYGCSSLNSINLDNIQYIGISAFQGSTIDTPTGLMNLNLNKAVFIGANAFKGATGIGSIDFSKNTTLTQVSEGVFYDCTGLSGDIDLSNATKLITIGSSTNPDTGSSFRNTAITNVYLPSTPGLRTITSSAFNGCTNLVTVGPKGTTGFTAVESVSGIYFAAFYGTKIASVNISNINISTTPLYPGAFYGMSELSSVNLGTTITTIPASCFMNCTSLTTLTLPASITSISGGTPTLTGSASITFSSNTTYPAFYGSGLTSIDLSNITSYQTTTNATLDLPDTIFYNCASLQSVTLKAGTTSIGQGSFAGTTALTSINTGSATSSSSGYTATSDLTTVKQYAFWQSGIASVDLSAITNTSYNQLQYLTFTGCQNLTNIKLPRTITSFASYSANESPNITTVNFGDLNLTSLGNSNFWNCKLEDINLSNSSLNVISETNTFSNLTENTKVELPSTLWNISSTNAFTYNKTTTNSDGTVTTTQIPLNISFPNGFSPSTTPNFSSGNLNAHTMFSRVSGSLDMSSFSGLRSIGIRTFFGGSVTSLTFNASTFANGKFGSNYSSDSSAYSYLGFLDGSSDSNVQYLATSLPFGNMTNLNSITFNKFSSSETNNNSSVMAKTSDATWNEVARIISSFAKEKKDATPSTTTNLESWNENDTVTAEIIKNDSNLVTSVTLKNIDNSASVTFSDSSNTGSITIANVTWTINVDTTNSTITISGTGIDTYRLVSNTGSTPFKKVYFSKTTESYNDSGNTTSVDVPNNNITVTLNVVPASTTK